MARKTLRKVSKHHKKNSKRRTKRGGMICNLNRSIQSGGSGPTKVPLMPASVKTYLDKPTWTSNGPQGDGVGTRYFYNEDVVPLPTPENVELPYSQCGGSKKKKSKRNKRNNSNNKRTKRNKKHKKHRKKSKPYKQSGGGLFPDITNFARVIGTDIGNFGTEWSGNAPYPSPLPWHQPIGAKTTILTPTAANVPQIQANADKVVAALKAPSAGAGAGGAGASESMDRCVEQPQVEQVQVEQVQVQVRRAGVRQPGCV